MHQVLTSPPARVVELDRLGDEIAELSAHLALLCRRHHRAVHEEGYTVVRDADGRLHFSTPRGRPIPEVPAPPAVPPDAMQALVADHRARSLAIDAWTACPDWYGERLDLGWAIGVLHPACQPASPRAAEGRLSALATGLS